MTAFQAFKFIFMYSMIEMTASALLYPIGSILADGMYLYVDMVALIPLSVMQTWSGAYEKLTKDMPTSRLFSYPVFLSVGVCTAI